MPDEWRDLFDSFSDSKNTDISHASIKRDFENLGKVSRYKQVLSNDDIVNSEHESKQVRFAVNQFLSGSRASKS